MSVKTLPQIVVVKKEDKEAKLKAFIGDHLTRSASDDNASNGAGEYLLIARSSESPVVRALTAVVAEIAAAGITLKAVVAKPQAANDIEWPADLTPFTDCRVVSDLRLLEGHEQLCLSTSKVWIGDCMRREPAKRDAYECFAEDCEQTARSATLAFRQFWDMAVPATIANRVGQLAPEADIEMPLAGISAPDTTTPTAATRH